MEITTNNGVTLVTGATTADSGFAMQGSGKYFCANGLAVTISERTDSEAGYTATWMYGGTEYSLDLGADVIVCGGSWDGEVASTSVTVNGGTINCGVFGGGVTASSNVTGNVSVIVNGGTLGEGVVGGGICGTVAGNVSIVLGAENSSERAYIRDNVIGGGFMESATVGGNVDITINNLELDPNKSGGEPGIITGGGVYADVTGDVTIDIKGGDINAIVAGGSMLTGDVANTTINVSGGTVTAVAGGSMDYQTSGAAAGDVVNATINVTGGTVADSIIGGSIYHGDVTGEISINVSGGTVGTAGNGAVIVADSQFTPATGSSKVSISGDSTVINGGVEKADEVIINGAAADVATIYVDSNFTSSAPGEGLVLGVNAFATVTSALAAAAANASSTVKVLSDVSETLTADAAFVFSSNLSIVADLAVKIELSGAQGIGVTFGTAAGTASTVTLGANVALDIAGELISSIGENTTIELDGAKLSAATVTNDGSITAKGNTTLAFGAASGNAVDLYGTLNGGTAGLKVRAFGSEAVLATSENKVKTGSILVNSYGSDKEEEQIIGYSDEKVTLVVNGGGEINAGALYVGHYTNGATLGEMTITGAGTHMNNGGGNIFLGANGVLTVSDKAQLTAGYSCVYGNFFVDDATFNASGDGVGIGARYGNTAGLFLSSNSNATISSIVVGDKAYNRGAGEALWGGTLSVSGSTLTTSGITLKDDVDNDFVTAFEVTENSTVTITKAVHPWGGGILYLGANNELILDDTSKLSVEKLQGTGSIVINVGEEFKGFEKVLDVVTETTFKGSVTVNCADGVNWKQFESGDIIVYDVDTTTIYVNGSYDGDFGTKVGDGIYLGINAFSSFVEALENRADDTTVLELTGDVSEAAPEEAVTIELTKNLTIKGGTLYWQENVGRELRYISFDKAADVEGDITVTFEGAKIEYTGDSWVTMAFGAAGKVNVVVDKDSNVNVPSFAVYEGSKLTVEDGGKLTTNNEVLRIYGNMEVIGNEAFSAKSASGLTADDRQVVAHYMRVHETGEVTVSDTYMTIYNDLTLSAGASVSLDNALVEIGKTVAAVPNRNLEANDWYTNPAASWVGHFIMKQGSEFTLDNGSIMRVSGARSGYGLNINAEGTTFSVKNGSVAEFGAGGISYGIVDVANSTFKIGTEFVKFQTSRPKLAFDNQGTLSVSGVSTLVITELTGNAVQAAAGATLKDSSVGGKVAALGDLNIEGDSYIKTLASSVGGTITVEDGKTLTLNNYSFGSKDNASAVYTLAGGTVDAAYGFFQHGTYNINSTINVGYTYYSFGSTVTVNGTLHSQGGSDGLDYVRGSLTVADGGKSIHDKALWIGHMESWGDGVVGSATVKEGGEIQANSLSVFTGSTLSVDGGSVTVNSTVTNNGSITVHADGLLAASGISGTGTITVDASRYTAGSTVKVINLAQAGSLAGKVELINAADENVTLLYGADGDVSITDAATKTVYYNYTWAGKELYADLGNGKVFGHNAFDKFDSSGVDTEKDWSNLLVLPADADTVVLTAGNDNASYGMLRPVKDITVKTEGEGYAVIDNFVNVFSNLTFAEGSKVKVLMTGRDSGANNQGDFQITVDGELYLANAGATHPALMLWGSSTTPGKIVVGKTGLLKTDAANLENHGTIAVYGTMEIGESGDASKLAGVGNYTGHLLVDGGTVNYNHHRLNFGGGDTSAPWQDAAAGCTVTITNGGVINASSIYFRNGVNNTLLIDGGSLIFNDDIDHSGAAAATSANRQYFDNQGTIKVVNGVLDMSKRTLNNALDAFTVAGESTVNIGTLTGESVNFLDKAVIKNSNIGGEVFVAGDVTFRGDNTFAMLSDFGNLTDYYGTTAPMKWTVEKGASVTFTNKARYGLGYGDNVTIYGELTDAKSARPADENGTMPKASFTAHGLVAQESTGWNQTSYFTVKDAYVKIGDNNSFGNKPGNYGGTYYFNFENALVDSSRITFYEALSKTYFTFKDSDVKLGTFMTRDADSEFTLDNTKLLSTTDFNGTDEGNYNAGTLNVTNGSDITYTAELVNTGKLTVSGSEGKSSLLTAPAIKNSTAVTINGNGDVKAAVYGDGKIVLDNAVTSDKTEITSLDGDGNVIEVIGASTVSGSKIATGKDDNVRIGWGTEEAATLTLDNAAEFKFGGAVYVGSPSEDRTELSKLNVKNGASIAYGEGAYDGSIYLRKDGELNVTEGGKATFSYANIKGTVNVDGENSKLSTINSIIDAGTINLSNKAVADMSASVVDGALINVESQATYSGTDLKLLSKLSVDGLKAGEARNITVAFVADGETEGFNRVIELGADKTSFTAYFSDIADGSYNIVVMDGVGVDSIVYSGKIEMTSGKMVLNSGNIDLDSVNVAKGSLNVYGKGNTINIDKLSGTICANSAELADSVIGGGTYDVFGAGNKITGTNSIGALHVGYSGTEGEVEVTGTFTGTNSIVGAVGTLNIGSADTENKTSFKVSYVGNWINGSTVNVNNADVEFGNSLSTTGTITITNSNVVSKLEGQVNTGNGTGSLTLDKSSLTYASFYYIGGYYLSSKAVVSATDSAIKAATLLTSIKADITLNNSTLTATGKLGIECEVKMDGYSTIFAEKELVLGAGAAITVDVSEFTGTHKIVNINGGSVADILNVDTGKVNLIYGDDGDVTITTVSTDTIYVNSTLDKDAVTDGVQEYEKGDLVAEGKVYGYNIFTNIDEAITAAGNAAANSENVKLVVEAGSVSNFSQYVFMTVGYSEAYFDVKADAGTYALDVNGTLSGSVIIVNNNDMTVSATGKLRLEELRTYGGSITVTGSNVNGTCYTKDELVTDANGGVVGGFGGAVLPTANAQVKACVLKANQGGTLEFTDTDVLLSCSANTWGLIGYNGTAGSLELNNTRVYVYSTGGYGDPVTMYISEDGYLTGNAMTFTTIQDGLDIIVENSGIIDLGNGNTFDGKLVNKGTINAKGTVDDLYIKELAGEITVADGAKITGATIKEGSSVRGVLKAAGAVTIQDSDIAGLDTLDNTVELAGNVNFEHNVAYNGLNIGGYTTNDAGEKVWYENATLNVTGKVNSENGAVFGKYGSTINIKDTAEWTASGNFQNNGTLNVEGTLTVNMVGSTAPKFAGTEVATSSLGGEFNVKGGKVFANTGWLTFGGGVASVGFVEATGNYTVNITDGGSLKSQAYAFINGSKATLNITGADSELVFESTVATGWPPANDARCKFENAGVINVDAGTIDFNNRNFTNAGTVAVNGGSFTGAVSNSGTFTVTDATFSGTVSNSGTFTVEGSSKVTSVFTGNLSFADGVVLSSDSAVTVTGDIAAAGDLEFTVGTVSATGKLDVEGLLDIKGITLPVADAVTTVYTGSVEYGSLVLAGSNVVDNAIVVDGKKYDVDFTNGISLKLSAAPDVEPVTVTIDSLTQTSESYSFVFDLDIKGGNGDYDCEVTAKDAFGNAIAGSGSFVDGTYTFTFDAAAAGSPATFTVNAWDSFGKQTMGTASSIIEVVDYTAPVISEVKDTVDGNKLSLSWSASDNFKVAGYKVLINGAEYVVLGGDITGYEFTADKSGKYTYAITAFDESGNFVTTNDVEVELYVAMKGSDVTLTQIADSYRFAFVTDVTDGDGAYTYSVSKLTDSTGKAVAYTMSGNEIILSDDTVKDIVVEMTVTDGTGATINVSGNSDVIDYTAPELAVVGKPAEWVQSATLSATAGDNFGSADIEYSLDGKSWTAGESVTVNTNGTVYFKATDAAGNVTTESVLVDKIDVVAPTLVISGNAADWTNSAVLLNLTTVDAASGIAKIEYSLDNQTWNAVVDNKLSVSANGTVYFKVTDVAGNVTTDSVVVDKIDTVAPELEISGNAAQWVKSVTLNAAASDSASDIAKVEYSLDGKSWIVGESVTVNTNGTVYFKATDKVGNVTTDSVVVDKIDNAAPTVSTSVNTTAAKVSSVLVSATAADAASGVAAIKYSLNGTDWMDYTESVRMVDNGNIYFQSIDALGNKSEVAIVTVDNIGDLNSDILHNGFSQIVGYDANRGAVGYIAYEGAAGAQWQGVWEWSGDEIAKWNVVAVGRFGSGSADNDGLLLYNTTNNTFAAWTDLGKGDYGYESLCWVESNFSTKCIANLDGDGIDDVLIVNGDGNFGAVLNAKEYKDIWHEEGKSGIELVGAGYFGKADGNDSLLVRNTAANTYELWHNDGDIATTWAWSGEKIADLDSDWEIAAIGDFQADGIDDIVVWQKSTGYMYAWEDGKAESKRWVGALEHGDWEVAAVGDYNSDGKEDLLLRELVSGWGGLGYWGSANADNWNDLNARIESDNNGSKFGVIA